ncbi:intradiol ring-cleavage dioxygenase [Zhihengliuella salsuginis]|uniref:3,4-dioxygenase subunit beta n=1 Tax=Zhihengliuella salsuginis TaxID=578222 RepID=A0ABQ3GC88_9MICC|nr:intradiol ring-cleavage dioxygenase [Zhihengliuella salsuginis]GHD00325.1 3,4-dioxygenase subunit beta [Zhihengliuella salsuginis]
MFAVRSGKWFGSRRLPRPYEDLEDQGLGFDMTTLLERRRVLSSLGLGAAAFGLAACEAATTPGAASSSSPPVLAEIPDEAAGPFPGDGSNGPDVLQESGILRSDIRSSFGTGSATAEGVPMTFELTLLDVAGAPMEGAAVYVWHCDRDGNYSLYSDGVENENYLRGVQIADPDGRVRFTSIFPACYPGRWPHVHFEVYPDQESITDPANAIAVSQAALPADAADAVYATAGYETSARHLARVSLGGDNVFGDDGGASQLAAVTGSAESGYAATLTAAVDAATRPAASER